jgi:hypothetical protein
MPFPTAFPTGAILKLLVYLRGDQSVPIRDVAEAGYDLLGYGLSLAFQTPATLTVLDQAGEQARRMTDPELAERLEYLQPPQDAAFLAAWSLPPWAVPVILEVLRRLLERIAK